MAARFRAFTNKALRVITDALLLLLKASLDVPLIYHYHRHRTPGKGKPERPLMKGRRRRGDNICAVRPTPQQHTPSWVGGCPWPRGLIVARNDYRALYHTHHTQGRFQPTSRAPNPQPSPRRGESAAGTAEAVCSIWQQDRLSARPSHIAGAQCSCWYTLLLPQIFDARASASHPRRR